MKIETDAEEREFDNVLEFDSCRRGTLNLLQENM